MTTVQLIERAPRARSRRPKWLVGADLAAVLLFAVEGALLAIGAGLDLFGVLVAAFASALGGGLVRDVLMHATPPSALRSLAYPATALSGGLLAVLAHGALSGIPHEVRAPLDAAALSLFCVVGTIIALDHRMRPLAAVLLGTLSAIGGGVIRDVMLGAVPAALRTDTCAVAAAAGAGVTVVALRCGLPRAAAAGLGAATCMSVSLLSTAQGWQLPPVAGHAVA